MSETIPAKTLEDAFNTLDPRQPVQPAEVPILFVTRVDTPVRKMEAQLRISRRPLKLLFVGHRGAGKSSEMAYLTTLLDPLFLAVPVPLYDIFKSPAVDHTEVIFAITLRLLQMATNEKIIPPGLVTEVWEKLLSRSYDFLKERLFGPEPIAADREGSITLKVSLLAAELETRIGTESYTRAQVKEKFAGRINELLERIEDVSRQMESKTGKKLLLVVEDLDKFDAEVTKDLFLGHARTLTAPYPSITYSFPVAMRYSDDFSEIKQGFDGVHILPNISLKHRDGQADEKGIKTMREILARRAESDLFARGVVNEAIRFSGGHVKTLIQLMQQAVLAAVVDGQAVIGMPHLKKAAAALRDDFAVLLKQAQIELLRQQRDDPRKDLVDITPAKQSLLYNGSLLEYDNTAGPWADVNPVVSELLERRDGSG